MEPASSVRVRRERAVSCRGAEGAGIPGALPDFCLP